jgi:cytochrome c peroxidase
VTGRDRDRHVFKVPSLRAAVATPPYFHDGSKETLEGAIFIMAFYQLGISLTPEKVDHLAGFIRSLIRNIDGKPIWP